MGKIYFFYCNACGDEFQPTRSDAQTCSTPCRAAKSDAFKIIKKQWDFESNEQKEQYKESLDHIEGKDHIVKNVLKKEKPEKSDNAEVKKETFKEKVYRENKTKTTE